MGWTDVIIISISKDTDQTTIVVKSNQIAKLLKSETHIVASGDVLEGIRSGGLDMVQEGSDESHGGLSVGQSDIIP